MSANIPLSDTKWHTVELMSVSTQGDMIKRSIEGDGVFVAAGLRALADQLDPPKPPRPGLHDWARDAGSQVRRSPGGVVVVPQAPDVTRGDPMSLQ